MPEGAYCEKICTVSIAELPIEIDRERVAEFCRARGIRKLSLFGSVLRDDFDPQRSDVETCWRSSSQGRWRVLAFVTSVMARHCPRFSGAGWIFARG
ncbi:MAG: nucleotidyltransferase family protein [Limisphaerales bacterium]